MLAYLLSVGDVFVDTDEHPKPGSTVEKLSALPPVFKKTGVINAGNASVCCCYLLLVFSLVLFSLVLLPCAPALSFAITEIILPAVNNH